MSQLKTMTFDSKQSAEAFATKCHVNGFAHQVGADKYIWVILFEGRQYAIVNEYEMVLLSNW